MPPSEGTGAPTSQVLISDAPMLETKGVHSMISGSPSTLPAASQESLVPLSQLQQSTPAGSSHSGHLPPNIISQLGFHKFGSP